MCGSLCAGKRAHAYAMQVARTQFDVHRHTRLIGHLCCGACSNRLRARRIAKSAQLQVYGPGSSRCCTGRWCGSEWKRCNGGGC